MFLLRRIALLLLLVALPACGREEQSTPEGALSAWIAAMNASRSDLDARQRAYELLAAPARTALAERAARASQLSGRDVPPWEMLAPGRFTMRLSYDPDALSTQIEGERATITARGRGPGERAVVPMVREAGRWRVDLALPPMTPVQTRSDGGP